MNIRITILVYILIAGIFIYGYMQLRYLKSELTISQTALATSQVEIKAIQGDIDKLTKAQSQRQDNRVVYTTKVVEIQKEKTTQAIAKAKQNPVEYQNKDNADFTDLSKQFQEITK